jgi:hypothetical protein
MNPKHFDTKAIRTQLPRTPENEHSTPLFLTSSFVFDNAEDMRAAFAEENDHNIYSRFSNPTVDEFVQKMVLLEEAEGGYATASGMSAVFGTFMTFLKSGDHILSSGSVFGSTHTILTKYIHRWKIEFSYFDISQPGTIESLIRPNTRMLYVETPSNPGLDMVDLELLNTLAKKHDLILVVDNCFCNPGPAITYALWSGYRYSFYHQMDRRSGPHGRWCDRWQKRSDPGDLSFPKEYRTVYVAFQCMDTDKEPRDVIVAHGKALCQRPAYRASIRIEPSSGMGQIPISRISSSICYCPETNECRRRYRLL